MRPIWKILHLMALGYLRVQVNIATGLGKKDYVQNILSDLTILP